MPSSPLEAISASLALASRLAGTEALALTPLAGSGNNRVFRVDTATGPRALKLYPSLADDPRDRLGHEFAALRFLEGRTAPGRTPRALAADQAAGAALYEWVEGAPVTGHGLADITATLDFLGELHAASGDDTARATIDFAIEPCLAPADIRDRIIARLAPLDAVSPGDDGLARILADIRALLTATEPGGVGGGLSDQPLPRAALTLSPSDFGFHNALRRPDGGLTFLDFEYFGWDDPAKAVCDFLWHAGQRLSAAQRVAFVTGALVSHGGTPGFTERLVQVYPLHGAHWALIVLNEFRPDRWARRQMAGRAEDWALVKRRQLTKAERLMERVRRAWATRSAPLVDWIAETGDDT